MNGKETFARVIFGPKIEGVVADRMQDSKVPDVDHFLIDATEGGQRHIILPNARKLVSKKDNLRIWHTSHVMKIGEEISLRIRGKGMFLLPWSNIERDPFGLKNDK
jgi:hypothetical protein